MEFSIKDFFSKPEQIFVDLVTFAEDILNGKFNFLYSVSQKSSQVSENKFSSVTEFEF